MMIHVPMWGRGVKGITWFKQFSLGRKIRNFFQNDDVLAHGVRGVRGITWFNYSSSKKFKNFKKMKYLPMGGKENYLV